MSDHDDTPEWVPSPPDTFRRMMAGEISPRQAAEEARAAARPEAHAFDRHLRSEMAKPAHVQEREQREGLRARMYGDQQQPRDEAGRFASGESEQPAVSTVDDMDGGARGHDVPKRSERQRVHDAIEVLAEHRGRELADHGEAA